MEVRPSFVDDSIDSQYLCVDCLRVLVDPMQTECRHRLCRTCVEAHVRNGGGSAPCPVGKDTCKPMDLKVNTLAVVRDYCCRNELGKLLVYCDYRRFGCLEQVPWADLENHMGNCYNRIMEPCAYKSNGCPVLVEPDNRVMLESHLAACDFQPEACLHCDQEIPRCKMQDHLDQACSEYYFPCPLECDAQTQILKRKLEAHMETCPNRIVSCRFQDKGCTYMGIPSDMGRHDKDFVYEHLGLVSNKCQQLIADHKVCQRHFSEKESQWKMEKENYEAALQKERDVNKDLKARVDQQVNMMCKVQIMVGNQQEVTYDLKEENASLKRYIKMMETQMGSLTEKMNVLERQWQQTVPNPPPADITA